MAADSAFPPLTVVVVVVGVAAEVELVLLFFETDVELGVVVADVVVFGTACGLPVIVGLDDAEFDRFRFFFLLVAADAAAAAEAEWMGLVVVVVVVDEKLADDPEVPPPPANKTPTSTCKFLNAAMYTGS